MDSNPPDQPDISTSACTPQSRPARRFAATPHSSKDKPSRRAVAVLINPYEVGRQPFALGQLAAWLEADGYQVRCVDLALQKLCADELADATLIAISLGMHTAARIALEAIPRIKTHAPTAHLCVFGLYAPVNAELFAGLGVSSIFGGEVEPLISDIAKNLLRADGAEPAELDSPIATPRIGWQKIPFKVPRRDALPSLHRYASLILPDGEQRTAAYTEASRGCKHLCRHCPVVPVYGGRFRIVPVDVVMADIQQQVEAGAKHVSFGDPDFFNGPTHARRVIQAMHQRWPWLTYDVTIKVEHLLRHQSLLGELKRTKCLFVTSAVESLDDNVLAQLDKGHTAADFVQAHELLQTNGIQLSPTFVAFTPWTTLQGYEQTLQIIAEQDLVGAIAPIQLAIRLLIPQGSRLLELPEIQRFIEPFDMQTLGYPWKHPEPAVDDLQQSLILLAEQAEQAQWSREQYFERAWSCTQSALGQSKPCPTITTPRSVARMSEAWYCCAEPTQQQLASF